MIGMTWGGLFVPKVSLMKRAEEEKKRPHTYKCSCEVTWIAEGLVPQPCWACGTVVEPECFHG